MVCLLSALIFPFLLINTLCFIAFVKAIWFTEMVKYVYQWIMGDEVAGAMPWQGMLRGEIYSR